MDTLAHNLSIVASYTWAGEPSPATPGQQRLFGNK